MLGASLSESPTTAAAAVVVLALVVTLRWAAGASKATKNDVPLAPNSLPLIYHTLEVLQHKHNLHDYMSELSESFGPRPFRNKMFGRAVNTVLNTPALFEDVLKTQFNSFEKGRFMAENVSELLGGGIFAVDGAKWSHQRKIASHLFTMRSLRDSMVQVIHELLPTAHRIFQRAAVNGKSIDLVSFLNRFTMEAFAKIGFGVDLQGLDATADHPFMAAFDSAQRLTTLRFVRPRFVWKLLNWLQIGSEAELTKNVKEIDDMVFSIITCSLERRQHRGSSDTHATDKNIVSLFVDDAIHAHEERGEPFDPKFLRDIVVNFIIAGRDTTAQALSWFFYELSENPQVETCIRDELRKCVPGLFEASRDAAPTMEQVQRLTYLEAALKETLRLHPSVPSNSRRSNRDVILCDGTFIPKETIVSMSSYSLGRATHVWGQDAKQFRPERWIDPEHPDKLVSISPSQFNAFLAGPRTCLGMNLAMMEMKILVASLLSRFQLEMVPGQAITYDLSLTLPVKGQILMRVREFV